MKLNQLMGIILPVLASCQPSPERIAVPNIPVGNKNLQQCADAVMRLRAEYFYERKEIQHLDFIDNLKRW